MYMHLDVQVVGFLKWVVMNIWFP